MARPFRLWGEKRGQRHTGSKLVGSVGEALFFFTLFLLGAVSLAALITTQIIQTGDSIPQFGWWLLILVFSSFLLIGGGGILYTALHAGTSTERRASLVQQAADLEQLLDTSLAPKEFPHVPSDANLTNSPGTTLAFRLPIGQASAWRLSAAAVFSLLSGAIAAVLLVVAIEGHLTNKPDWFLTFFMLPILIMAAWSFYYLVRQLIVHTGVGPTTVEISSHPLHPGEEYQIFLSQSGRLTVDLLEMLLTCEEEATYHQGTDVRTEKQAIYSKNVFCSESFEIKPGVPFEHSVTLQIPPEAMHSFQSGSNSVHWKLVVRGEAKGWPSYERSFPIVVYPPR